MERGRRIRAFAAACCLAIAAASMHAAAQAPPGAQATQEPQGAPTGGVQQVLLPEVTNVVEPVYPSIAVAAAVSGTVIVGVAIDADGRVQTARIAQSVPLLDDAALDAVRQWEFAPPVVDGKPVPTGVNVAIGFVLGPGGDVPVPSVPSPRPLWLPEDFAFEYTFSCRTRGGSASIDMQQFTAGESARIEFSTDEIQSIYMRMFAAGAFAVPAASWRPEPGVRTAPDGFRLQVRAKPPARESAASPFRNRLDVRHYGVWRRVEWLASDDGGRPEADDQLETIGGLIREFAAQKPEVRELPADQRQCLAE